ncbi:MAG: hypothetical protein FJX72_22235, partial [Armatimonadetes bacterium]|nr:hypothetical protein [Armatimonadota bacterium]
MSEERPRTLFDFADQEQPVFVAGPSIPGSPVWDWPLGAPADYIAPEFMFSFVYSLDRLGAVSPFYTAPVLRALLTGLRDLAKHPRKMMRNQAFTVFHADALQFGAYVLGIGVKDARVSDFLGRHLRAVAGFREMDHGTGALVPIYRYDHGFVIEYTDDDGARPHADSFATGLTL